MNNIFCVISAIGNDYGAFTYKERFQQLLESIDSINTYAPDSDIVIVDASEVELPGEDVAKLKNISTKFISIHNDQYVQFLRYHSKDPSANKFEKKTVGEIQAMIAFLNYLNASEKEYDRVYKLAGRYKLNEHFNFSDYNDKKEHCVFLTKEDWYGKWVFRIRLWSFDYKSLNLITGLFYKIQKHTYDLVTNTKELEIVEYVFTKMIEEYQIPYKTVDRIGVCGLSGVNSTKIDE